jgi:amidohydrolase family protein
VGEDRSRGAFRHTEYNQERLPFLEPTWWHDVHRRLVDFEELRLPTMDEHGIGYAVVSLTTPGVQGETDAALAVERARLANDALAEAVAAWPDRFGGFAAVALQDVGAAVVVAELALGEAGTRVAAALDMTTVRFVAPQAPDGPGTVDVDGRYLAWFATLGADVVVVRPDFYVYAAVAADHLGAVLETLGGQLSITAAAEAMEILDQAAL